MKSKKEKILSMDKFIHQALYDKKFGYYMKKNPFGQNGDYITSPNISVLFSEMISIWIILFWENLKCPKRINLIELGSGNGEMIKQIIKTFKKFPIFKKCCKINILEKSPYLKKIQKKKLKNNKIKWLKNLSSISNHPSIFIANEFFDAMPIKQFFKKKNKWFERYVKIKNLKQPTFLDVPVDIKKVEKKVGFKISFDQKFIEFSPLTFQYLKNISKKIQKNNGGLLIIDYGYWEQEMKNTLQSIYKHKFNNILNNLGKADITYNINFALMEKILKNLNLKINGKVYQKDFLKNLGILKRAEIISKNLSFSKKADIYYRVKRLIDENQMGVLFKVILATNKKINFNKGFAS